MTVPDADEALRRRLYGPDVTAEDVARYRAVAPRPEAPAEVRPDTIRVERRGRRPLVPLLAAAGVAALLVVAAAALRSAPEPAPAVARPALSAPEPVAISAASRETLTERMERGDEAAVSTFFYEHPESLPAELRTPTRADTEEFTGVGSRTVDLDPSATAMHGGRMTVVLVLGDRGAAEWRALRLASTLLHSAAWRVVARRGAVQGDGLPTSATFRYAAPAPTRLAVTVPRGVRWDVAVVYSN